MKKILSRILLALNILLILFLLLLSGVMVYMTAAKPAEIFGHTAVLVEIPGDTGILCIVDKHPAQIVPGDTLLLRAQDGALSLLAVDRNDGKLLYYKDEGKQATLPVDDPILQGRVTSENDFLGGFFSVVVRSENVKTTYISIGIGFGFCAVAILLTYFLSTKFAAPFTDTPEDRELLQELLERDGEDAYEDDGEEETDSLPQLPRPLNASGEDGAPVTTPFPQLAKLWGRRKPGAVPGAPLPEAPKAPPTAPAQPETDTYSLRLPGPAEGKAPAEPPLPAGAVSIDLDEELEVRIYTPHSTKKREEQGNPPAPPAAVPPREAGPASPQPPPPRPPASEQPQTAAQTPGEAYDLYDLSPNISELLDDIERQFHDLDDGK